MPHALPFQTPGFWLLLAATVGAAAFAVVKAYSERRQAASLCLVLVAIWAVLGFFLAPGQMLGASLQTGLLDPMPLVHRSVNLVLLPLADANPQKLFRTSGITKAPG